MNNLNEWTQYLFSKKVTQPGGQVDEYHILTSPTAFDLRYFFRVQKRDDRVPERVAAFIQDCGDSILIGVDGFIPTVLTARLAYGYERYEHDSKRGRIIHFTHGYLAKKNTQIPNLDDLLTLQKVELEKILEAVNSDKDPFAAEPVRFQPRRESGLSWDEYARGFESGRYLNQGAAFASDTGELICWLKETNRELEKKKPQPEPKPSRKSVPTIPIVVGLAAAMMVIILLLHQLSR